MAFNRFFLALAVLLFFLPAVFSQEIFVNLRPVSHSVPVTVYDFEPVQFDLIAFNNEDFEAKNFNARVSVGPPLSILIEGIQYGEQLFSFQSIPAKSSAKKSFILMGNNSSNSDVVINVKYGIGESLANNYSASMRVEKSPLSVNARLKKNSFAPLEGNELLVDLKNVSSAELTGLSAELLAGQGLSNRSSAIFFDSFAPNQSVLNSPFAFGALEGVQGEKRVSVLAKFSDGLGDHLIEKNFSVQVGERNDFVLVFAAILAAVALFLFFNRQKSRPAMDSASLGESHASH